LSGCICVFLGYDAARRELVGLLRALGVPVTVFAVIARGETLADADGVRVLAPQTVEALTARHRVGMFDETFKHVIDWGLGFLVDSNLYGADTVPYGYGPHASRRAFGHSGRQSSLAFADPEQGLVVAVGVNGMPGERLHDRRMRSFTAALYENLGLAG